METELRQKNEEDHKNYELSVLLASENAVQDLRRLLSQHRASIVSESPLKKIGFAYKIGNLSEGYFEALSISALPSEVKLMERDLKTVSGVLRSLVIGLPKGRTSSAPREVSMAPRRFIQKRSAGVAPAPKAPKPLSNEALEKKIEEILQ